METQLRERLEKIKRLKDKFNLTFPQIAEASNRGRTTVALVFGEKDDRYLTEGNISAIEEGIQKILKEYKQELDVVFA